MHFLHYASSLFFLAGALLPFTLADASQSKLDNAQVADADLWLDHWASYQDNNKGVLTTDQTAVFDLAKEFLQNPSKELDDRLLSSAKSAFGHQTAKELFTTRLPGSDETNVSEGEGGSDILKRQQGCGWGCHCNTESNWCDDDLPCVFNPADQFGCRNWHINCCGTACYYECNGRCGKCPNP